MPPPETQTVPLSDRLREQEPSPAPEAPAPAAPAPAPGVPSGVDPETSARFTQYRESVDKVLGEMRSLYDERQRHASMLFDEYQKILNRVSSGKPMEEPPQPFAAPLQPSRAVQPFLEGGPGDSGSQLLQKITLGLGTIATMTTALALKYPEGALAAWTGAMQGWAEGDALRGDRAFGDWKAAVIEGHAAQRERMDRWHALRDLHKDNWEQMKLEMAVLAAKDGAAKEYIEAALKQPELVWQFEDRLMAQWNQMQNHADQATLKRMAQASLEEQRAFTRTLALMRLENQRIQQDYMRRFHQTSQDMLKVRLNESTYEKFGKPMQGVTTTWRELDDLDAALIRLDKKGLLPKGASAIEGWFKEMNRTLSAKGDPDLMYVMNAIGPVFVGEVDRRIRDDKGVRAFAMFAEQLKVLQGMGPIDSMLGITKQVRGLVRKQADDLVNAGKNWVHLPPDAMAILEAQRDSLLSNAYRDALSDLDEVK